MDLIESDKFCPPMILLQTVLEEVRHRSLPLYNRLKTLINAEEKRIWVFYNEYNTLVRVTIIAQLHYANYAVMAYFRATAVIREDGESPNDRNDRGQYFLMSYRLLTLNVAGITLLRHP